MLIISKEFRDFDRTNERLDLLAVDYDGKLVIIELKRDDSGADVHWQAIKYASYLRRATNDNIIGMLAGYRKISEPEAENRLLQHLAADDLTALNNDQRIILASHRFAREVTTAVLWLNEKSPNLITCIQLIPYHDRQQGTLYIQASTIIPLPVIDNYLVGVGDSAQKIGRAGGIKRLSQTFASNRNHETTPFLIRVGDLVIEGLPDEIKPDGRSRYSRQGDRGLRYYRFWYSRRPWNRRSPSYQVNLVTRGESGEWQVDVEFHHGQDGLGQILADISFSDGLLANLEPEKHPDRFKIKLGRGTLNDDFGDQIAAMIRTFITAITPAVDDFEDARDEQDD